MGHLPIVNQETISAVIEGGCLSIRSEIGTKIVKTVSDIFSDVLVIRAGDFIFPWIIHGKEGRNLGFKYVFRAAGNPRFVAGDDYPVKVPLSPEGLEFEIPLSEADALDLWDSKLLWNAIGKKSLGRGRSVSHQTPMEDQRMIQLLMERNPGGPRKIKLGVYRPTGVQIRIDSAQETRDSALFQRLESMDSAQKLSSLDLNGIPWKKGRGFCYEKTLEAWLMSNMDGVNCAEFRRLVDIPDSLEWFGNYLPFGVQGSNIDVVVISSSGKDKLITVIELKVGPINQAQFNDACRQVLEYCEFLKKAFKSYGLSAKVNPVVLAGMAKRDKDYSIYEKTGVVPKLILYGLDSSGKILFDRKV